MPDKTLKPNINEIASHDLRDPMRLLALYQQAIKSRLWGTSEAERNDFFSLSQHALRTDTQGSPGKLFRWLLREKDTGKITERDENTGQVLLKSALYSPPKPTTPNKPSNPLRVKPQTDHLALVSTNDDAPHTPNPNLDDQDPEFIRYVLSGDEITYMHPIMVQCFFPQRRLAGDPDFYETEHGNASLVVEAGRLFTPESLLKSETKSIKQSIPYGALARLLIAYINGQVVRTGSPLVDMGSSLRQFLRKHNIAYGGKQGRALLSQLENIAAATITLGLFGERSIENRSQRIVEATDFWLETNERQATLWQPEVQLSRAYTDALLASRVPLSFTAFLKLKRDPRAMDIYCWLAYRLHKMKTEIRIPWGTLQPIFGPTIDQNRPDHFKEAFKKSLKLATAQYPEANVFPAKGYLIIKPSKPAIQPKQAFSLPK